MPSHQGTGLALEAISLFVDYIFSVYDFRKLYGEAVEFTFKRYESAEGRFFDVEGRLKGDQYYGGQYWDLLILAIDRGRWAASARLRDAFVEGRLRRGRDGKHAL